MILEVFSVYDSKAEAYLPPFFQATTAMAKRIFANVANDPSHQFGANPGDYGLFLIGTFDDEKGIIEPSLVPKSLGLAQEFMKQPEFPNMPLPTIADIAGASAEQYRQAKGE